MSLSYDELLARVLLDPAAEAELLAAHRVRASVLVLGFTGSAQRMSADGPAYALALARAAEGAFATALEVHEEILRRRLRDGMLLVFETPEMALEAALDGLVALADLNKVRTGAVGDGTRSEPIGAGIGLGFGDLLIDPGQDATSTEGNHAFHLAGAARPGEVLATDAFMAELGTPPQGIGTHRARADRIHMVGMPFHVVGDYRG